MSQGSSFTEKERAQWHKQRRRKEFDDSTDEQVNQQGETCTHCGAPIAGGLPAGYEGGLCSACE